MKKKTQTDRVLYEDAVADAWLDYADAVRDAAYLQDDRAIEAAKTEAVRVRDAAFRAAENEYISQTAW